MSELVAELLQGLDGLHPGVLYLLAGLFTALETSIGIGLVVPGDSVVLLAGTRAWTRATKRAAATARPPRPARNASAAAQRCSPSRRPTRLVRSRVP